MTSSAGSALEREGHDRSDINLPGSQVQLLQDVTNTVSSEAIIMLPLYIIDLMRIIYVHIK